MQKCYDKWNSVYIRFRRWAEQVVWDALLATFTELGRADDSQHMINSTAVLTILELRVQKRASGGICSITRRVPKLTPV